MASTAYVPWAQLHRRLNVCQTRSLPLRPKLQDKQRGFLHRKTTVSRGASESAVCAAPWVWQAGNNCHSNCPSFVQPRTGSPLATRARQSRSVQWVAARKTKAGDAKTRAPDTCKSFLLGDTGAPEYSTGRASRWYLSVSRVFQQAHWTGEKNVHWELQLKGRKYQRKYHRAKEHDKWTDKYTR